MGHLLSSVGGLKATIILSLYLFISLSESFACEPIRYSISPDLPVPVTTGQNAPIVIPPWENSRTSQTLLPAGAVIGDNVRARRENHAAALRWLRRPVSFELQKRPLGALLRDFATQQGVACQVSPKLDGEITGTFSSYRAIYMTPPTTIPCA